MLCMKIVARIFCLTILGIACWQINTLPSISLSFADIAPEIRPCLPAVIRGKLRLQAKTEFDRVGYHLYYVSSPDSDAGYDILIQQEDGKCQQLLGPTTKTIYPLHRYIPAPAAFNLYRSLYQDRINQAGGVSNYQKKLDGDNAAFGPFYLSDEEQNAMRSLGLRLPQNVKAYPESGWMRSITP